MRVRFLGLWLPLLFACSGTNVVAGPEQTEAERIEKALPAWCDNLCKTMSGCEAASCDCADGPCPCIDYSGCNSNCEDLILKTLHTSAACAVTAGRLQECYDVNGCGVLDSDLPCREVENDAEDCADYGSYDPPPPPDGYSEGSAGSANLAPGPTGSGPNYGPEVTCQGGFGGGQGAPEPGTTQVICDEGRFDCSDSHDYSMVCVATSAGQRACTCLVDALVTGAFGPGESCPTQAEMNAGCGWRLAEL